MSLLNLLTADVRIDLTTTDDEVMAGIRDVMDAWVVDGATRPDLTLTARHVQGGGRRAVGAALAQIVSDVDHAAMAATPCLAIHAACVAGAAGAILVPGASGVGKSTLAAACMQSGMTLLSDEAACLRRDEAVVVPHARPLGLSAVSRRLLGLVVADTEADDNEVGLSPSVIGRPADARASFNVAMIALPRRARSAHAELVPVTAATALAGLLANCLNVPGQGPSASWTPGDAWRRLAALVTGVPTMALAYDDPHAAATVLGAALR